MSDFWLCFVPLFVAVDVIGVLPIYLALTEELDPTQRYKVILQSVLTASAVALVFLVYGPVFLSYLGITVFDFMIAGGILLFAISLSDLLTGEKRQRQTDLESLGAVPLGIPLITGPAVLTTCIVLSIHYGKTTTALAAIVNIAIAGVAFWFAHPISNLLGRAGTKTVSKIANLLLATIGVMLIRKGLVEIIKQAV